MEDLPQVATHFFTQVNFDVISEIDYQNLEKISQLAKANSNEEIYLDFRESLIKLMWAKMSGLRAASADLLFAGQYEPQVIVQEFILQIDHEKSVFEFISNVKSSLDAMATFLNQYFLINEKGGNIDFKRIKFRNKLIEKESSFKNLFEELNIWFQENRGKSDSIISIRDFWIHQSTPLVQLFWPPTSLGALQIPKNLKKLRNLEAEYWKTQDFVTYHYSKLANLFMDIVNICIKLELVKQPHLEIKRNTNKLCFFPMNITSEIHFKEIRIGKISSQYMNSVDAGKK